MACPMRVVYATLAATVVALIMLFDLWRSSEEMGRQLNGGHTQDSGGQPEVEEVGAWAKIKAVLDPRHLWRRLWEYPLLFALLVFLHVEILLTNYAISKAMLGEERLDLVVAYSGPLQDLAGRIFGGEEGGVEADGGGSITPVIRGSGCYWKKRHECTYDLNVCCAQGCAGNGGLWLDGSGGAVKGAPPGVKGCVSGQGGCTVTDCGIASEVVGAVARDP